MASLIPSLGLHFHVHNHSKVGGPVTLSKAELEKIFMKFDANKDNCLNREELKQAFVYLGAFFPVYRADGSLHHADANGDGQIHMNELDDLVKYAFDLGYTVK